MHLTHEKFDALLRWLHSDRDTAGLKYKTIHAGLIAIFAAEGFSDAEGLADEVMNRVAERLPQIGPAYSGEPARYFRGVARKVICEARRRKEIATDPLPEFPHKELDVGEEYKCLLKCLEFLTPKKRALVLDYHIYDGADKIANHVAMAEELNVSVNNLRVKVYRIRARLEKCVFECLETNSEIKSRLIRIFNNGPLTFRLPER